MNPNPQGPSPPAPTTLPDSPRAPDENGTAFDLYPEVIPNLDELVIEDGKPVDNLFTEKQYRLLTEPLYSCWEGPGEGRPFMVMSDVGLFYAWREPPFVPDVMLSLDVKIEGDPRRRENLSYFMWVRGKAPDVVIEIVSDRYGSEETYKFRGYARVGVPFYVIFDPNDVYGHGVLRAFELRGREYVSTSPALFNQVGLGLTMWQGEFEGAMEYWLRWCGRDGQVIPTGHERAEQLEAEVARLRALLPNKGQPEQPGA